MTPYSSLFVGIASQEANTYLPSVLTHSITFSSDVTSRDRMLLRSSLANTKYTVISRYPSTDWLVYRHYRFQFGSLTYSINYCTVHNLVPHLILRSVCNNLPRSLASVSGRITPLSVQHILSWIRIVCFNSADQQQSLLY